MTMPYLDNISVKRDSILSFGGIDRRPNAVDGTFINTKNISSAESPHISPRGARGVYKTCTKPSGLMSADDFCYVDGSAVVIGGKPIDVGLVTDATVTQQRKLVRFGAYVLVFPDKVWVNATDGTFGNIDAKISMQADESIAFLPCRADGTIIANTDIKKGDSAPENPTNGSYWLDTSEDPPVMKEYTVAGATFVTVQSTYILIQFGGEYAEKPFSAGDTIKISGVTNELGKSVNGSHYIVADKCTNIAGTGNWDLRYVVSGILGESFNELGAGGHVRIERKMPALDHIIESGNRLWGCRYGEDNDGNIVNEIYASALGDFKNWEVYQGVSTDSYRVTVGNPGKFTGAYTFRGYPHFFKEDCVIKVYGAYPSAYQTQVTECDGVHNGCARSLAVVNGYLYYKARTGVYAFDGSLPYCVSTTLGDAFVSNTNSGDAVAAGLGDLLYIRTKELGQAGGDGQNHLYVYDTSKNVWMEEDNVAATEMCEHEGDIYFINGTNIMSVRGNGDTSGEALVEWSAETNDMGDTTDERKYVSRLSVMMQLPVGSRMNLSISYDGGRVYERVFSAAGRDGFCHEVPVRIRRCERFRLKFDGVGEAHIQGIVRYIEYGSAR